MKKIDIGQRNVMYCCIRETIFIRIQNPDNKKRAKIQGKKKSTKQLIHENVRGSGEKEEGE